MDAGSFRPMAMNLSLADGKDIHDDGMVARR